MPKPTEKELAQVFAKAIKERVISDRAKMESEGWWDEDDEKRYHEIIHKIPLIETIQECLDVLRKQAWDAHGAYGFMFEALGWNQSAWGVVGPWGNWDT